MQPGPVLFSREVISTRVRELGARITRDYRGQKPCLVAVLKGASLFHADLMRAIDLDISCDFVAASSYGSATQSSGKVRIRQNLQNLQDMYESPAGKDIIIVEDIVDTGLTLQHLHQHFLRQAPASLKIAALIDKPSRRRTDIRADYVGFPIADKFIVGYGMDYAERYRHLPDIHILREIPPEDAAK